MGWLAGWAYRRAITITEQSGSDLTDYQVRIELNSSNFDFSKANADGSDIRFTKDDGETLLPHWIEKWDSSNQQAVVWVKVPSIPANSDVTIYMYYGNSRAVSESDGEAVFEFFDDFDTFNANWQDTGQLSWDLIEVANGELHLVTGTVYGRRALTYNGYTFTDGIIEARIRIINYVAGIAYRFISDLQHYRATLSKAHSTMAIQKFDSGKTTLASTTFTVTTPIYYHFVIKVSGSLHEFDVFDDAGTLLESLSATDATFASGGVGFWSYGDATYGRGELYVDWIRVRKYAEQEPTVSVSTTEESAVINISGVVQLPDGTPVGGAWVVAVRQVDNVIDDATISNSDGTFTLTVFKYKKYSIIAYPPGDATKNGDIKAHIQT